MPNQERRYKIPSADICLKFTAEADLEKQAELMAKIRGVREVNVIGLNTVPALSRICVLKVRETCVEDILKKVKKNPGIKYAELVIPHYPANIYRTR